jgi:hypothetical protein
MHNQWLLRTRAIRTRKSHVQVAGLQENKRHTSTHIHGSDGVTDTDELLYQGAYWTISWYHICVSLKGQAHI